MIDEYTVQLVDLTTGDIVASLSETQLEALKTHLEIASENETNFYITPETLDFLRMRDANEVADLLARVLDGRDGISLGYAPISRGSARARGQLRALEDNAPIPGYKVEVYDEDVISDDLLGWCYCNRSGEFELRFDESDYKDTAPPDVEGRPEIKLRISNIDSDNLGEVGILRDLDADFGEIFVSTSGKLIAPVLDPTAGAICPRCGTLYRDGVPTCSEDQTPLRPLNTQR